MDRTLELIQASQQGDTAARDRLFAENTGLVWSVVKKFGNRGYEMDDLFQIGAIGLMKCIDKFDTSFGVKFSTYAVPMIMGEIKRFLRDDGIIKVSRPLKEAALKAKYMQENLQHKTGRVPTMAELAAALDMNVEDLAHAMDAGNEVESLYTIVHQGDGSPVYLLDKLDNSHQVGDESMIDKIALREVITQLAPKVCVPHPSEKEPERLHGSIAFVPMFIATRKEIDSPAAVIEPPSATCTMRLRLPM